MVIGIIYGSLVLVVGIVIAALLISGKGISINVKHISECKETKDYYPNPGKKMDYTQDPNWLYLAAQAHVPEEKLTEMTKNANPTKEEVVNMDGVITAVNEVMGIEHYVPNEQEKENK